MRAVEDKDRSSANTIRIQGHLAGDNIEKVRADTRLSNMSLDMLNLQMPKAVNEARVSSSKMGSGAAYLKRIREIFYGGSSAFKPISFR